MLQDLLQFHQINALNAERVFYTWSNGRLEEDKVLERIDQTFANSEWLNDVLETTITSLLITISDHSLFL